MLWDVKQLLQRSGSIFTAYGYFCTLDQTNYDVRGFSLFSPNCYIPAMAGMQQAKLNELLVHLCIAIMQHSTAIAKHRRFCLVEKS